MLPKKKSTSPDSPGVIHLTLLFVVALAVFLLLSAIPKKSVPNTKISTSILSKGDDNYNSNSGPASSSEDDSDKDKDEDEPKPTKAEDADEENDQDENNDEDDDDEDEDNDADEIEELEFENEDEDEGEEMQELVEGDKKQRVEVKVENGKVVIKIKTKNRAGREVEQEIEATTSANIASLNLLRNKKEIKIKIRSENGRVFLIEEKAEGLATAETLLPITLDSENNVVSVQTSSGNVNITEFPGEVLQSLLSSNLDQLKSLELKVRQTNGKTKVVYHAKGENGLKFLGLFNTNAQVEAEVDAATGTQEIVSQPWYLKYLSFLFSQ